MGSEVSFAGCVWKSVFTGLLLLLWDCAVSFAHVACHLVSNTGDVLLQLVLRMQVSSELLPGCSVPFPATVPALCPLLPFSVPPAVLLPEASLHLSTRPPVLPQVSLSPVAPSPLLGQTLRSHPECSALLCNAHCCAVYGLLVSL